MQPALNFFAQATKAPPFVVAPSLSVSQDQIRYWMGQTWCPCCSKLQESDWNSEGFKCCIWCGKIVQDNAYSDEPTFFKNVAGQVDTSFLDYYDIPYNIMEVNPIRKKEIKWSDYQKVPIVTVDGKQLINSSDIIDNLYKRMNPDNPSQLIQGSDEEREWIGYDHCIWCCPPNSLHVRARRGQATDSHNLTERVRREKISERMKLLQDLVPGCNKVIGKALVLDEIINYIQSLQRQVEFLSMKLEIVNSRLDTGMEGYSSKEVGSGFERQS